MSIPILPVPIMDNRINCIVITDTDTSPAFPGDVVNLVVPAVRLVDPRSPVLGHATGDLVGEPGAGRHTPTANPGPTDPGVVYGMSWT